VVSGECRGFAWVPGRVGWGRRSADRWTASRGKFTRPGRMHTYLHTYILYPHHRQSIHHVRGPPCRRQIPSAPAPCALHRAVRSRAGRDTGGAAHLRGRLRSHRHRPVLVCADCTQDLHGRVLLDWRTVRRVRRGHSVHEHPAPAARWAGSLRRPHAGPLQASS